MHRLVFFNLRRAVLGSLRPVESLAASSVRQIGDDSQIFIGGGLEKLQGGLKEESYFRTKNYDLVTRIREQGSKLKCEDCLGNWAEFEKALKASVEPGALRDSCSANKHKNSWEEAFFMNEQNECTQIMKGKFEDETNFEYENPNFTRTNEQPAQQILNNENEGSGNSSSSSKV